MLRLAIRATGTLVLASLALLELFVTFALAQLAPREAIGVLTALAVGLFATGALMAVGVRLAAARLTRLRPAAESLLMGLVFANVGLCGLHLFRGQVPGWALALPLGMGLVGLVRGAAMPASWRSRGVGSAQTLAAGLAALPLLATPACLGMPASAAPAAPTLSLRPDAPPLVVLVTFDALRARSLAPLADRPHFAELAADATWYTNCRAASDRTLVSVPALLTGRSAESLLAGVRNRSGLLEAGQVGSVAGTLRRAGYATHYATMLVSPEVFGMADDFEDGVAAAPAFRNYFARGGLHPLLAVAADAPRLWGYVGPEHPAHAASALVDDVRRTLAHAEGRTFLWVHVGVPHAPYVDLEGPASRTLTGWGDRPTIPDEALLHATPAEAARLERTYERYVGMADTVLGEVLGAIKASGRWNGALVIATADHGESFEAGRPPHSYGRLPEDIAHVPLLIHRPGQRGPAQSGALCGHEDLAPTMLGAVLATGVPERRGRPLATASDAGRVVVASATFDRRVFGSAIAEYAAYQGPFKYVYDYETGAERLFDLERDPQARRDVLDGHPAEAEALRKASWPEIARSGAKAPAPLFPPLGPDGRLTGAGFGAGWSHPEAWGRWTDGPRASVRFSLAGAAHRHTLTLTGTGFGPAQAVTVSLNGHPLGRRPVGAAPAALRFEVEGLLKAGPNAVVIDVAHPMAPSALGTSGDGRALGFGLIELAID